MDFSIAGDGHRWELPIYINQLHQALDTPFLRFRASDFRICQRHIAGIFTSARVHQPLV